MDEFGNIVQKTVLDKYDEEISGERMSSFRLSNDGRARLENDGQPLKKINKLKQLQSLDGPKSQLASEYLTEAEMVSFKKVKKKRKKKKMLSADDLLPMDNNSAGNNDLFTGSRQSRIAAMIAAEQNKDKTALVVDQKSSSSGSGKVKSLRELMEEDDEDTHKMEVDSSTTVDGYERSDNELDSIELQEALVRTRRAKVNQTYKPSSEQISDFIKENKPPPTLLDDDIMETENLVMTLNTTDEFCRTLGDIPTYGLSGNRAEEDAAMLQLSPPKKNDGGDARGAWEEVDIEDTRVEITDEMTQPILEEEPDASRGVANALKLAIKKGYLEKDNSKKAVNAALQHLRAVHYR